MLSFRQLASVLWTFLGFMIVAGLVLNLRYKPVGEGDAHYLDTWTGKIHAVPADLTDPVARYLIAPGTTKSRREIEIRVLEGLLRREADGRTCGNVRFAVPAPEVIEVR
jgi:hypothetical protein